jgi:D-3-phosphoglycerate dehydrogenase / 2-oxoglutarate reductase
VFQPLTGRDRVDVAVAEDVWGEPFERLATALRVRRFPDGWAEPDRLVRLAADARALVVRNRTQVTRDLFERLPRLEVVARAGVGLDNVDLRAADDLGIVICAPLGGNAASVAEYTLGAAIAAARRVIFLDRQTRAGQWHRMPGHELAGKTWGLIGLGATGRAVAHLVRALPMDVVAHDPYADPDDPAVVACGARLGSLEETLRAAHVLSIHVPATPDTRRLIDAHALALLRTDAILVNVARGEVLDEEALADALANGRLYGAVLDVRASEPPQASRFEHFDNVVLTPHIAGITVESQQRIAEALATDIEAVLSGGIAQYAVGVARRGRDNR